MSPLYAAVTHGCAAGKHQEALNVYYKRIQRGNEFFNFKTLGAYVADLAILLSFFEIPWEKPMAGFSENERTFVVSTAGGALRALGRLREAAQLTQREGLDSYVAREEWENAAVTAINLTALHLTMGDLTRAFEFAYRSVGMANDCGDEGWKIISRAARGEVLHQAGRAEEADAAFQDAITLQAQRQPRNPFLFSLAGFQYNNLLLDQGNVKEMKEHAAQSLALAERKKWPLETGLHSLSLGRAWL